MRSCSSRWPFSLMVVLACACAGDPASPETTPATIVAGPGTAPSGVVGTALGPAPTFEVRNGAGDALGGVSVTVRVASGGGALSGNPAVSAVGPTSIGQWTLGPTAGAQTVTVAVSGVPSLVITATATPGAAAGVQIASGNNQTALAGTAVGNLVQAKVVDQFGNARPSESITWSVADGAGSLVGPTTTVANAAGVATAPAWTLGKNGGLQRLRASFNAFESFATATIQSSYTVDLRWVGTVPTGATLAAFTRAVDRIRAVVVGGVTPIGMPANFTNISACNANLNAAVPNQTIPGVIIYAVIEPIDGLGQVLGSAGPCLIRDSTKFFKPALGTMRFDDADVANLVVQNQIDAVILHEMLHVIGIGTIWSDNSLITGSGSADARYTGARGRAACATINFGSTTCATSVPVHSTDGAGTRDAHWRESIFGAELMTPFLSAGASPFSAMTIESLGDFAYSVNLNSQDAFTVLAGLSMPPSSGSSAGSSEASLIMSSPLRMPAPLLPKFIIERSGRLTPIRTLR